MKRKFIIVLICIITIVIFLPDIYAVSDKGVAGKNTSTSYLFKMDDKEFLDLIQKKAFLYFWNESNPKTGLVKDKTGTTISSIAAVGFGLTCICIAENRGWVKKEDAYQRILNTLKFFKNKLNHKHGFYYHFVDMNTGEEMPGIEVSSIDTALFIAGALFAGKYFKGTEIENLAQDLYKRIDWQWMLNGGTTLSLGWKVSDFLIARWNKVDESLLIYLLAIGSPTHPIPASSWDEIRRPVLSYENYNCVSFSAPLFVFQYPHLWIDFRDKHDKYTDYFKNSVNATLANRQFCIDNQDFFETYGPNSWGITACDGPGGYKAYRALPSINAPDHDGTIAPTGAGTSMMFTPEKSLNALKHMYSEYKDKLWGEYGFKDAYNIDRNWFSDEVIGIDQGALMIGIENYRTGLVWKYFMKNDYIKQAMEKVGFEEGTKDVVLPQRARTKAFKTTQKIKIDGNLTEWKKQGVIKLSPSQNLEYGNFTDTSTDLLADCYFMWDKKYLYFAAEVIDNDIESPYTNNAIYRNDCAELFVDPDNDGLMWRNPLDYQIGLSPSEKGDTNAQSWSWFQLGATADLVQVVSKETANGYIIESAIDWKFLNLTPKPGLKTGISVALHDLDSTDNTPTGKLNWYYIYRHQEPYELGELTLVEGK